MEKQDESSRVPDGPQIKAETWFALAIAASIITLAIFSMVAIWVFHGDGKDAQARSQAFTPFGAVMIAAVTFFTVAWRGVLNTRQLEYQAAQIAHQAEQLAQTKRQNDAKDEENIARLLIDGTKLLGEEKNSHVLAGIAVLQAVVVSPEPAFAIQAMDILADLVHATCVDSAKEPVFDAARYALDQGALIGRCSTRGLSIKYEERRPAPAITGVNNIAYKKAGLDAGQYAKLAVVPVRRFADCEIYSAVINWNNVEFNECKFIDCTIETATVEMLEKNTFVDCNFSGALISGPDEPADWLEGCKRLRGKRNWFFSHSEPITGHLAIDWTKFLDKS